MNGKIVRISREPRYKVRVECWRLDYEPTDQIVDESYGLTAKHETAYYQQFKYFRSIGKPIYLMPNERLPSQYHQDRALDFHAMKQLKAPYSTNYHVYNQSQYD